uniref:Uncharacterized protein n=1 Tax=Cacopsylla melanoneura TaxID=428564 RepID=A0A8D8VSH3_9HEMI
MYFKVGLVLLISINSISSYVITETVPTVNDYNENQPDTPSQPHIKQYYPTGALDDVSDFGEDIKTYPKDSKTNEFEPKLNPVDVTNVVLKENKQKYGKHPYGLQGKDADTLGKFQGIPYYVTKNNDIIGASDVNIGTLGQTGANLGPLANLGSFPNIGDMSKLGSMVNMESLANMGAGAPKMNFTLGSYMKYLTKNSSLTPADMYKYVFSKKCTNSYNLICLKLDLIKILSNINNDNNRSISIIPHLMSLNINSNMTSQDPAMTSSIPDQDTAADQSGDYGTPLEDERNQEFVKNKQLYKQMVLENNYNTNYYINNILKKKIMGLLDNMSVNIKLFDNNTIAIIKKLVYGYNSPTETNEELRRDGEVEEKAVFDGREPQNVHV